MKIDLHTHTIISGHAFGTIKENVEMAKKKGISLLGVTDHGPAASRTCTEVYFKCGDRIPKTIDGVRVIFGVEANIINNEGELDLPENTLKKLDFVMVGFHKNCGYNDQGVEKNTEVLIKAMENKYVKIVSHPYGLEFKVNMEEITKAAIKNNVLLELNASYFYRNKIKKQEIWDGIKLMVNILKENNQKILINSDAHSPYEIGKFEDVLNKFADLGINKEDILNNDVEEVLKYLDIK